MSNRLGCKTTEVGEFPEDWEVVELRSVVKDHKAGIYKPRKMYGFGYNIAGVSNLYNHDSIKGQIFRLVNLTTAEKDEFSLKEGDIIYGESSLVKDGIGKALVVTKAGEGTVFAWHTRRLTLNRSKVEPLYIHYALNSPLVRKSLISRSTQTALTGITVKEYLDTFIPLPSLQEQRKIASILSCVDAVIEKTDEVIQETRELKKGLMQQLLTKGIGHIKFKQTEVGEIPEEWLIIPFGEICQNTQLGTAKRGLEGEKKVALIKMGNLTFGGLDLSDLEMVGYDGSELDQYKLERGDFLFNTRNTPDLVGKTAVWNGGTQEAVFDNNIMRIYFKSEYVASSHMINYFLSSDLGRRWLRMRVHQTTSVAAIYWKQLRKIPIPIPPFDEQKRIINILLLHDAKIENETQKKAQLMKLKKGLMQDLLTGKVRVKVD